MKTGKTKGVSNFEVETGFYEKVLKKQREVTQKKEDELRKKLAEDLGKEGANEVFKRFTVMFDLCSKNGENEEAIRIMEDDYMFFEELLKIIRDRSKMDVSLNVEVRKINEDLAKKEREYGKKIEGQKKIAFEILKESVKYKARMDEYEKLVSGIMYRRKFNVMNESAIRDLERERKAGQKITDMVMSKRVKMTVDYGNFMEKKIK